MSRQLVFTPEQFNLVSDAPATIDSEIAARIANVSAQLYARDSWSKRYPMGGDGSVENVIIDPFKIYPSFGPSSAHKLEPAEWSDPYCNSSHDIKLFLGKEYTDPEISDLNFGLARATLEALYNDERARLATVKQTMLGTGLMTSLFGGPPAIVVHETGLTTQDPNAAALITAVPLTLGIYYSSTILRDAVRRIQLSPPRTALQNRKISNKIAELNLPPAILFDK